MATMWQAVIKGSPSELEAVFARGALPDANFVNEAGKTPLFAAAEVGKVDSVARLLRMPGVDVARTSNLGRTPAHAAVLGGYEDVLRALLPPTGSRALLEEAARGIMVGPVPTSTLRPASGSMSLEKQVLKGGEATAVEVDAWDAEATVAAVEGPDPTSAQYVDPNTLDNTGHTALSLAAKNGCFYICAYLVSLDAVNINVKNRDGMTALMFAAKHGQTRVVRLLTAQRRIDIDARNDYGHTAFKMAEVGGHIDAARLLWKASAFKLSPLASIPFSPAENFVEDLAPSPVLESRDISPAQAEVGEGAGHDGAGVEDNSEVGHHGDMVAGDITTAGSAPDAEVAVAAAAHGEVGPAPTLQTAFGKVITCGACGGKGHSRRSNICPLKKA